MLEVQRDKILGPRSTSNYFLWTWSTTDKRRYWQKRFEGGYILPTHWSFLPSSLDDIAVLFFMALPSDIVIANSVGLLVCLSVPVSLL